VVSGNTQDFNKQESEQEGNIHRKAIGKDKMRRTASLTYESAKLNSLLPKEENTTTKDFDELVSEHEDIIMEARRTTKVVGRALKSLGVASPLRRVTEVIPKFGGLHHHLRSQLMRHKVDHVEVRQRKYNISRRAEFINRFDLGEFKALFQNLSDDDSSCFEEEEEEEISIKLPISIHNEFGEDDLETSKKSSMSVDISEISVHENKEVSEQESSPLQQDFTKNAMVPINVEFANDSNLHEQSRKSNNYVTSWHSCDDSSSDGSSGSYKDEDIDVLATYFGTILGVNKNNASSCDSNDDVSGMFENAENECQFTSREMERLDDIAFIANFLYSFPGNATSFDDVFKPTSLCISSGYRFEYLMSIFSQYRDETMSNSMRNGLSAASSVSRFTFDDDVENRSEGCAEETDEPEERLAVPVVNDMMDLKKLHSVMERLFLGKKGTVEVLAEPILQVQRHIAQSNSIKSFTSLGDQISVYSLGCVQDDCFSVQSDSNEDDGQEKQSAKDSVKVNVASSFKSLVSSPLAKFGFQRPQASENDADYPSNSKQEKSQQNEKRNSIPESSGVDDNEDDFPAKNPVQDKDSTHTTKQKIGPRDIGTSSEETLESSSAMNSQNSKKGWWPKAVPRVFANESTQPCKDDCATSGLNRKASVILSEEEVVEFSVSITSVENRVDEIGGSLTVFLIEVTDENDDHTYTIEHRFSEFERLFFDIKEQKIKMTAPFPGQGVLGNLIGKWSGGAPNGILSNATQENSTNRKVELNAWLIELTECLAWGTIRGELRDRCVDFLWHSDEDMKYNLPPKASSEKRWKPFARRGPSSTLGEKTPAEAPGTKTKIMDYWPSTP